MRATGVLGARRARAGALLGALAVPAAATAQWPQLDFVIVPGRTEARVDAALAGSVVVLFAGVAAGRAALPGGTVLGIAAPTIAGVTFADVRGMALFSMTFPIGAYAGSTLLAQAVAWDIALPLGHAAALAASPVRSATVPQWGDFADIHVLFGQSNAEGHAEAAALPVRLRGPLPRCRIWNDAAGEFQAMENGVNTHTYSPATWCGPELTLVEGLAGSSGTIHLVKCAFAMTALGPTPGRWNEWGLRANELYAILRYRIDRACAAARANGLEPRIRGIFMMQGESDATNALQASQYATQLDALVRGMRSDLIAAGLAADGDPIPFVLGAVDPRLPVVGFPFVMTVRAAQQHATETTSRCALVETMGLGLRSDGVHFDTAGVMALGASMAAAVQRL